MNKYANVDKWITYSLFLWICYILQDFYVFDKIVDKSYNLQKTREYLFNDEKFDNA